MENIDIQIHKALNSEIAELSSSEIIIRSLEDGVDLVGNLYYQGIDRVVIYEKNITPAFFDLKTGLAGEILQKFTNYRLRTVIVGDFSRYSSNSLRDFILESNKGHQINFVSTLEEAINLLSPNA
ncbi:MULTISPECIES: DUF4180 domain-containing protein [Sphingobacterium]|uniref:DUF4180 domain-containing protein n=1 Tax=Sphingobacterium populi TaxID=1812824 RepID=A0ABW5UII5_9SPHI|nr:DUF4180 domain-containing protein [Sphingobacterium sp. CFCC 11742]